MADPFDEDADVRVTWRRSVLRRSPRFAGSWKLPRLIAPRFCGRSRLDPPPPISPR